MSPVSPPAAEDEGFLLKPPTFMARSPRRSSRAGDPIIQNRHLMLWTLRIEFQDWHRPPAFRIGYPSP